MPICLEPSVIVDLLQIWLPRDDILNEQLLNIIRIPLYSHEFIKDAEVATSKIISLISRFSSADGLTEETIHKLLLNKTLREKIVAAKSQEEEVQLIQDNLLNFIDEANKEKDRIVLERNHLERQFKNKEIEVSERDAKLNNLEVEQRKQSEALNGLKGVVDDTHNKNLRITSEKNILEERLVDTQQELDRQRNLNKMNEQWQLRWDEVSKQWVHFPILLVAVALIIYFGGPWIRAAFVNTTIQSIDLKTLLAIPGCLAIIWQFVKLKRLVMSINLILRRSSFKEQQKQVFVKEYEKIVNRQ